ncbi:MAG: cytochrome c family protein [Reyranella sp.]
MAMIRNWIRASAGAALSIAASSGAHSADAAKGERVFRQCKTCHTVEKGGKMAVGPNLYRVLSRKAGALEGFSYSEAMRSSGLVWDETSLAEYLKDPRKRIPGNKMVFAGLKRQEQIDDLIAYLTKMSD